ncbi:TPA: hypothetical protein NH864_002687 [Pseudomonas aeruginosa]|uniref:hypothetical protein n=1 Tax=Pseudomonas aeruginosa TaxID=287 RepID=UPI000446A705|nr:hypothetical protein [Pseudomonas aeruginosa]EZP24598.1 hypothetical protein V550_00406 [Pseudomonas aeruginosa BWH049]MBI8741848.1 hypothetical protein [Pseudomonas aeruginosa]MBX5528561.1 hypothetical protein [Pseudomonas aeruginosa]MBX5558746.1 hypothetical protein [Pseudomonas aeruginosa]MBX5635674.1 hypothetical protein [Pseudomonas aeruginosa]
MSQQNTTTQPPRSAYRIASDLAEDLGAAVDTINGLRAILTSISRDEGGTSHIKDLCAIGLSQAVMMGEALAGFAEEADAELEALDPVATQSEPYKNVPQHEGGAA